jgi:hypothetical protein
MGGRDGMRGLPLTGCISLPKRDSNPGGYKKSGVPGGIRTQVDKIYQVCQAGFEPSWLIFLNRNVYFFSGKSKQKKRK